MTDAAHWHYPRTWRAIGVFGIGLVIALSLLRLPDIGPAVPEGDKYGHALGYFTLMLWHVQLARSRRALFAYAIAFVALGLAMEFAQTFVPGRQGNDPYDALANTLGIALATALGFTPLRRALVPVDRWIARR